MPILIGMFFSQLGCKSPQGEKLIVAASANTQYAMEELIDLFEAETGTSCELIVGSSGKLTAQILEGAPFDLFFSADMKYPEEIYRRGKGVSRPEVYAYGYLVFWSLDDQVELDEKGLINKDVRHIAMANPETAPYGRAALELLNALNVYDTIKGKLVFGESIAQTNQFILSGSAEIGLTALSVVSSPVAKGKGNWKKADPSLYQPIAQGFVHLATNNSEKEKWSREFTSFLRTEAAMNILHKFGYGMEVLK